MAAAEPGDVGAATCKEGGRGGSRQALARLSRDMRDDRAGSDRLDRQQAQVGQNQFNSGARRFAMTWPRRTGKISRTRQPMMSSLTIRYNGYAAIGPTKQARHIM